MSGRQVGGIARFRSVVPMVECRRRALEALAGSDSVAGGRMSLGLPAADVGSAIWPDRRMDRRGAGFAAARVLDGLAADGLALDLWETHQRLWYITSAGTRWLEAQRGPAA